MLLETGANVGIIGKRLDLPFQQLGRLDLDSMSVAQPGDEDVPRGFGTRENGVAQPAGTGDEALVVAVTSEAAAQPAVLAKPTQH
jgi:hypothetical protein